MTAARTIRAALPAVSWKIPERLPIVPFLEANFRLSARSSDVVGPYRLDNYAFWREPYECFTDPTVREISIMCASQTAKTTFGMGCTFYTCAVDPTPTIVCLPTTSERDSFVAERLRPAINESPAWAECVANRQWAISQERIDFLGMPLFMAIADSEASLAAKSCGVAIADEIGKYPKATAKEGGPLDQLRARLRTFRRSKFLKYSTPTGAHDGIAPEFAKGDRREWMVPCGKCGEQTAWKRENMGWEPCPTGTNPVEWYERIGDGMVAAWWECPKCGHRAKTEGERNRMNAAGAWKGRGFPARHASFHIPALCGPHMTFADYCRSLALALFHSEQSGDDEPLKFHTQHHDALPWVARRKIVEAEAIVARVVDALIQGLVPDGTRFVTAGVDVQRNGFYIVVKAWSSAGNAVRSHVIDNGFIAGGWEDLERELLDREYKTAGGETFGVALTFIDSGDQTIEVYRFCNGKDAKRVRPVKGAASPLHGGRYFTAAKKDDKKQEHKGRLVNLSTDRIKDWGAARMEQANATFHAGTADDPEFQIQLTAEERGEDGKWQPRNGFKKRNHYFDASTYADGAAIMLGILKNSWRSLQQAKRAAKAVVDAEAAEKRGEEPAATPIKAEAAKPSAAALPGQQKAAPKTRAFGRSKFDLGNSF